MPPVATLLGISGRVVVIYVALLVLLRLSGRRELSELSPMELLTMLLLSETVSPAITGGDASLAGGLVAAVTLILLNVASSVLVFRSRLAERVIEGHPSILISHGRVHEDVMRQEKITADELHSKLHEQGVLSVDDVAYGFIETDGNITIVKKSDVARH